MKTTVQCLLFALVLLLALGPVRAQLSFTSAGGEVAITGYNTAGGLNMVIPSSTNGLPVTSITPSAFQFSAITNVVIPNSMGTIGEGAFYSCQGLKSATLPASVTNLGRLIFGYCLNLTNISVASSNPAFSSVAGLLCNKAGTALIQSPCGWTGNFNIPGTITSLGAGAFSSTKLASVNIPASVTNMGNYVFNYSPNLTNIVVPGASTYFSTSNGVLFNKAFTTLIAFPGGIGGSYTVPSAVTNVGPGAFDYSILMNVYLPNGLRYIDLLAFGDCPNLTSIIIPASVTNVTQYAFASSFNLARVYFLGHAPAADGIFTPNSHAFSGTPATVFYLPGKTNWPSQYGDAPTVLWNPQASQVGFNGGGQFQFNVSMPSNSVIVVEASTDLAQSAWTPLATNVYSGSPTASFTDTQAGNHPVRLYRFRAP